MQREQWWVWVAAATMLGTSGCAYGVPSAPRGRDAGVGEPSPAQTTTPATTGDGASSSVTAEAGTTALIDPASCSLDTGYTYGWEGGAIAYVDHSKISTPLGWVRERRTVSDGHMMSNCNVHIPACGTAGSIDVSTVVNAIYDPDVIRTLRTPGTWIFGVDPRPAGGQIFAFRRDDGPEFYVGAPCQGRPNCVDPPDGVGVLVGVLSALDAQQLASDGCASLR